MAKQAFFFISIIMFTNGTAKKISKVLLSLLEDETRQGNHLKNPRQALFIGVSKTDVRSLA